MVVLAADEADKTSRIDDVKAQPVYIINPGDQLLITVFGHERELTAIELVVVRPDGMITYPIVGEVEAAGLTILQLTAVIRERLWGYYEDPQLTVQLRESTLGIVYVFGAVKEPGQKKFPRPVSVIEALASAGQLEETADPAKAKIIKKGKEVISVDLSALLKSDVLDQDVVVDELLSDRFMLEDGDVLIVPSAVRINIIGQVNAPGRYYIKTPINLLEALALAGGTSDLTADLKHVKIIRSDGSVEAVDITRAWSDNDSDNRKDSRKKSAQSEGMTNPVYYLMVQPGDTVVVPEKGKINIMGFVLNQGQFVVDDEINLVEALVMAGIDKNSNLKKLRIIRSTGEQVIVDASRVLRKNVQADEEKLGEKLSAGDTLFVPSAFRINWSAVSVSTLVISTLYAVFFR